MYDHGRSVGIQCLWKCHNYYDIQKQDFSLTHHTRHYQKQSYDIFEKRHNRYTQFWKTMAGYPIGISSRAVGASHPHSELHRRDLHLGNQTGEKPKGQQANGRKLQKEKTTGRKPPWF